MIDIENVQQQQKMVQKMIEEINNQNRIFEQTIDSAMKGAPESDKKEIEKIRILAKKAISLAKQGKSDEAQNLIKQFSHGNQNS